MPNAISAHLETVGGIVARLEAIGLEPILVGGMALVVLGSRRVTRDFDFLVSFHTASIEPLLDIFYAAGFELASRVDADGDIVRTIDNRRVAAIRLRLDTPTSVYFLNRTTGLRIDLLFDFPVPAHELIPRTQKIKIQSQTFRLAARRDLLKLKQIAYKDRKSAADRHDIMFLKKRPQR